MKKVINITLSGIVFAIEQDAYDLLEKYLEEVKNNLSNLADVVEVIDDIECAIAEKFSLLNRNEKIAVTSADVEVVKKEMGRPSDFNDSVTEENNSSSENTERVKRRLYRDTEDKVIAGVSSGIANYFDIDPVIVRVIFVVSALVNGFGILAYIILWLVVPAAKTTAEKYAMRGEKVTVADIAERVKKNLDSLENLHSDKSGGVWKSVRINLEKLFSVLGLVIRHFLVFARVILGAVFILAGALGVAALVTFYTVFLLSDKVFIPVEAQNILHSMLGSTIGILLLVSVFIVVLIPLLVMMLAGVSLVKLKNIFTINKVVLLAVLWIIFLSMSGTLAALQFEDSWQEIEYYHKTNEQYHDWGNEKKLDTAACTMEAKRCPDGSFVGRVGPDCEFEKCPILKEDEDMMSFCSPESRLTDVCTMDYAPVCGVVEVQCVTTPCDPVSQTFSNSCSACSQGNVVSYTEGECENRI